MMRTALFVALCAYSATASDQSRVAQELDEDLTPDEQIPGVVPTLSPGDETAVKTALGAVGDIVFGTSAVSVTSADVDNKFASTGYTVGQSKTTRLFPGTNIPQITFTIKSAPVTTAPTDGTAAIAVSMTLEMDTAAILADVAGQKTALGLNLAIDLEVLYSQISALTLDLGNGVTVGREAKTLTTGDVQVSFNICTALGCLGSYTVQPATYTAQQLTLAAFDRAATAVTFGSVITAFPLNYVLANNEVGMAVSATVKGVPEQVTDSSSTNVVFYMGVDVDWDLISNSAAMYKKAWQFAVANRLVINPFRVTDIAFVRMSSTTTVSRRAEAQAIERVNAHQTVCVTLCAPNQGSGGAGTGATAPPSFSDDDDSSIIAVAVIVPIAVIAIVLVIIWYVLCSSEEEKKAPVEPYGGEAAGPDQTDEPVPANEDDAV